MVLEAEIPHSSNDEGYVIVRQVLNNTKFSSNHPGCLPPTATFLLRVKRCANSFSAVAAISNFFPFYKILASFYSLRAFAADILAGLTMAILHIPQGMAYGYLAGLKPINGLYTSFFPALTYFFFGTSRQISVADILAGLTMAILHIPQGMAYGYLAGLKPINGLYTSFFPALTYFFFGTSRQISVGTFSVVAMLSAEPVNRLATDYFPSSMNISGNSTSTDLEQFRLVVAITVTILAGLIQVSQFSVLQMF
ncbi:hypothetical protein P879_09559 [Paragonimus westermani]|uniref:SLC26A/SulP transporter domain-containing protein n=1 Tax=Paragonimus westermani TaxID=34504 RepID=A0A8T0DJQ3_9TREM|nr:hypothetical protein P879_09559 [Paragonimus westermani]